MINFPGHVEIEDNAKEPAVNSPRSSQKNILKVNCNKILCNVGMCSCLRNYLKLKLKVELL